MAPRADHLLHTEDILAAIEAQHPRLALVLLGGVNYLTGQVTLASYTAGWARATSPGSVAARDASGPEPGPGPNPHRHRTPPYSPSTLLTSRRRCSRWARSQPTCACSTPRRRRAARRLPLPLPLPLAP